MANHREHSGGFLIAFALDEIEWKYDGLTPLCYHNRSVHTESVLRDARQIASLALRRGKIDPGDILLVEIAAAFHDIELGLGPRASEYESAHIASTKMRESGQFSSEEIWKVSRMILATQARFIQGTIKQNARADDFLSQVLADADLAYLGSKEYWPKAQLYLHERLGNRIANNAELLSFAKTQIPLLEAHSFYTEEAAELFSQKKANIALLKDFISSLH